MYVHKPFFASIFQGDDSVCLADYCDIFRCQAYLPPAAANETSVADASEHNLLYPDLGVLLPYEDSSSRKRQQQEQVDSTNHGSSEIALAPPPEILHLLNVRRAQSSAIHKLVNKILEMTPYV